MQSELTLIEQLKLGKIWDFPGGIHPPQQKALSNQQSIGNFTTHTHYLPLQQHIGAPGELLVAIGDSVLKGQALTKPTDGLSLPIHAPTSGVVVDIIDHIDAHPSGKVSPTLILEADGKDNWSNKNAIKDWLKIERADLVAHIQQAGISGLGGAGFPTYVKLSPTKNIDLVILNGVECEPYITADDVLMRYHASDILQGAQIIQHLTQATHCIIAVEDNKPQAIEAISDALAQQSNPAFNIELRVVPTKYPSGGEKQLVELLTGMQVPAGQIPADIGIVMQNVGTSYAIKKAVIDGEPLISRVVTVTGERINNPQNFWVPLGTPIKALLQSVGYSPEKKPRLIMGGPMMGFAIVDDMMPVVKSTNCILAPSDYHLPEKGTEQACIRCGLCADACPAELLPQQLQWFAKANEHEKLKEYDLFDCIECGACAYVCPSQIPLVQYYRIAKADINHAEQEKRQAEKAKRRFEERQERLERDKQARLKRHKESADKRKKALANDTSAKDKIAAALARAKAKKTDNKPQPFVDKPALANDTSDTEVSPQDKVAQAIARAKAKKQQAAQDKLAKGSSDETIENSATLKAAEPEPTTDPTKDRVAAAIARAKAKKLAQQQSETNKPEASENIQSHTPINEIEPAVNDSQADLVASTEAQARKAKVAAAIAKAKAKKQLSTETSNKEETLLTNVDAKVDAGNVDTNIDSEADQKTTEQDDRKAKVAAAVAKAKAKRDAKKNATLVDDGSKNK